MNLTKVIVIGGAPGPGKTTLGRTLAIRLEMTSLTIDDLMTAARTVTTAESHPALHIMATGDSCGYFTNNTPKKLITDARIQHDANRPAVESVIRSHAAESGSPIVIDGWSMHPQWIADLGLASVRSFWLHVDPSVLEARERANTEFFRHSGDPDRTLKNFLARSLWFNDLVKQKAQSLGLPILEQDGSRTPEELCEEIIGLVEVG